MLTEIVRITILYDEHSGPESYRVENLAKVPSIDMILGVLRPRSDLTREEFNVFMHWLQSVQMGPAE